MGAGGPVVRLPLQYTRRFLRDTKKLDKGALDALKKALEGLLQDPKPAALHFHKMQGYENLYCMHVTSSSSHKVSMSIEGSTATLRRYASHREIDDDPL